MGNHFLETTSQNIRKTAAPRTRSINKMLIFIFYLSGIPMIITVAKTVYNRMDTNGFCCVVMEKYDEKEEEVNESFKHC